MQRASGRSQACSASPYLPRMSPHPCSLSRRLANPRVPSPTRISQGLPNGELDHARARRACLIHACGASDELRDGQKGASRREHPSPFASSPHHRSMPIEWAESDVEQDAAPSSPPQHATVYSPASLPFVCAGRATPPYYVPTVSLRARCCWSSHRGCCPCSRPLTLQPVGTLSGRCRVVGSLSGVGMTA